MNELIGFFHPKSVAVIGASREAKKIGYVILQNFVLGHFHGNIYPINPNAEEILHLKCHPSVLSVRDRIDLAVIAIPAPLVPTALEECGRKKINNVIIVSGGFEEVGRIDLKRRLEKILGKYQKMRVIGPNCLGILDTRTGIDTLFLPSYRLERPKRGGISFISQSGALGSAVIDWAAMQGFGLNKFISYGNALDVNEADLLEALEKDGSTKVIIAYFEGMREGRKFFESAKKVSRKKPIIAVKGGRFEESSHAVKSHTGSLAGSSEVYSAAFKQAGIIQANSSREAFDFARTIINEPEPKGRKVQIITNGGGYGVLAADAAIENDLILARMNAETVKSLKKKMPERVVIGNPMDLTGDADNERFRIAIEAALNDNNVDSILVNMLFQVPTLDSDIVQILSELNKKKKKPLLVMSIGGNYSELHRHALEKEGVSTFISPFNALKALRKMVEHHYFLKKS